MGTVGDTDGCDTPIAFMALVGLLFFREVCFVGVTFDGFGAFLVGLNDCLR